MAVSSESEAMLPFPEAGGEGWTAGHSGSETSHERALGEAQSGAQAARQALILSYLDVFASEGMTVADVREVTGLHHGQASSVLSVLHKVGKIVRLQERRDRCQVYVLPEYVNGREVAPYTPNRRNRVDTLKAAVRAVIAHETQTMDDMGMASTAMIEYALENPEEAMRRFG